MAKGTTRLTAVFLMLACASCADSSPGGVVVFDRGYSIATAAPPPPGPYSPDGLIWHNGWLYVADEGGSAIRRFRAGRWETLADRRSGFVSPEDIVVGPGGLVYFTDDSAGGLWAAGNGRAARVAAAQVGDVPTEGLAIGPQGELLVGNPRKQAVESVPTGPRQDAGTIVRARIVKAESIAADRAGNVWVADNQEDVIHRFAAGSGDETRLSWPGVSPESIALVNGALWFTDSHNGKVYRLEDSGRLRTVALFAGSLANVSGIAADPAGSVYVSIQTDLEAAEGTIVVFRKRG